MSRFAKVLSSSQTRVHSLSVVAVAVAWGAGACALELEAVVVQTGRREDEVDGGSDTGGVVVM